MTMQLHHRWMIRRDMPEVMSIAARSFADPMPEEEVIKILRQSHNVGMVAEWGELVVGYYLIGLAQHHLSVIDFAVEPAFRRRGIGRQMAAKLADKLHPNNRTALLWPVPESNLDGHLFLRSVGLRAVEIVGNGEGNEDVYLFEHRIGEAVAC